MQFSIGSLVKARGREWVVLPESVNDFLVLRPLGGGDHERAGIYLPLEAADVKPARFDLPNPDRPGDFRSSRMLRDAVRLGFRSSAGPFRSFARMNVEPRPYQLVPLLMALRLDPVRLLIADDVGIGKTVEAAMIARELLDRGEIRRLTVLCPPHLAEQWQSELHEKFHIEAELVLPSTVQRLERNVGYDRSLFEIYPFTIVSTDYIKASRRRDDFVRACPEFVIVDEAHTCAYSADERGGRHLRYELLRALSKDERRHLLLVTATPHSGDEGAFRSLLSLLRSDFGELPADLSGESNRRKREEVARHLVQRRRADVRHFMQLDTPFPQREEKEVSYKLSSDYHQLLAAVLTYARQRVTDKSGDRKRQRVAWWSVLAMLRSLASSPAAAAETLRSRSVTVDSEEVGKLEEIGERSVLDLDDAANSESLDVTPGSLEEESAADETAAEAGQAQLSSRLRALARRADALKGPAKDHKLAGMIQQVKSLLSEGYNPILFCRFIATAEYVADELDKANLPKHVMVMAITSKLPPEERQARVEQLGACERRLLVATDCLSEGINLQSHFDAVVHYDLSWNPTRHEQRDGRVDRYNQASPTVRTLTYYGIDNQIDGLVLDVLLRKHKTIRNSLGVSVPVPGNTNELVQALMEGLILRGDAERPGRSTADQLSFFDLDRSFATLRDDLHRHWENVSEREKRSRTLFAQSTLDVGEVLTEWQAMRSAIGTANDVARFVADAVTAYGGALTPKGDNVQLYLPNQHGLRDLANGQQDLLARFELPVADQVTYLARTHPFVSGLAQQVMDSTLDPLLTSVAQRCGAIRTRSVQKVTTLLLLRQRFHIVSKRGQEEQTLLAEACEVTGFAGNPAAPTWLMPAEAEALLDVEPDANLAPPQASQFLRQMIQALPALQLKLDQLAVERGEEILIAHQRVRSATQRRGIRYEVQPQMPVDVLGVYLLLPV